MSTAPAAPGSPVGSEAARAPDDPMSTRSAPTPASATAPLRPDGTLKVTGEFAFSSDLWVDGMLWGATLRSPHPRARIVGIDITGARSRCPACTRCSPHEDVPGAQAYGLEHRRPAGARHRPGPLPGRAGRDRRRRPPRDRPPGRRRAIDGRLRGAAAGHRPARRAARTRRERGARPAATCCGTCRSARATRRATAAVVVTGEYEVGMQDQAFLGPESGLAVPAEDGGVDLYVATQWLHVDRGQVADCLGLPPTKVRLTLAGVGGAFGAPRGPLDAGPRVHAGAAHRPAR